jgi:hypothetical protein
MLSSRRLTAVLVLTVSLGAIPAAYAVVTPEQRKELAAISKELGEAGKLLRKKDKVGEAEKIVQDAKDRLEAVATSNPDVKAERLFGTIERNIELRERAIALAKGEKPKTGVSFSEDVAPVIKENCLGCHGAENPRAGLRLDTFAGWKQGGRSKLPLGQVLIARLTTPNAQQRMPKDKPALSQKEIETIAKWIATGAKFDGKSDDDPIGEAADEEPAEKPAIAKPSGGETVSFVEKVAPFMVNICGRCHMGNNPRGGFNITTFEGVMKGGESGKVIEPGDPEASRLWRMVSNKEQPRMPPGQLLITRDNYNDLTTWIKEGAKFDGDDPKKPLRDLIPSAGEMQAKQLAKLSPEEFAAHRVEKSEAHWKKAFPKEQSAHVETDQFLVYGNVPPERLKQVAAWGDEQAVSLRSAFGAKDDPLWKGKLAVFVIKDRFGYEEFALAVNSRSQVPAEIHGHVVVSPDSDDAYAVVEDVGDTPSASSPGLRALLANELTQAYLRRDGAKLPDWAVQGTGLHVAAQAGEANPYFRELRSQVPEALKGIETPEQLFADGTFSPTEAAAVGYALVDFLIQYRGPANYSQFLTRLGQNGDAAAAIQAVYRTTPAALATAFGQNVAARRGR